MSPLAALGSVIDSVTMRAPPQMTSSPDYVKVENVGFHKHSYYPACSSVALSQTASSKLDLDENIIHSLCLFIPYSLT